MSLIRSAAVHRSVWPAALLIFGLPWTGAPNAWASASSGDDETAAERSEAPPSVALPTDGPQLGHELADLLPGVDFAQRPLETLAPHDLERGQKGYGISVFAGDARERFDVEIIGLWQSTSPELVYILSRLSGQGLERSGVMQGMSGSPVFVDGKLIGAVSFSFTFGLDPIAGITPIGSMRSLAEAGGGLEDSDVTRASAGAGATPFPAGLVPSFDDLRAAAGGGPGSTASERAAIPPLLEKHLRLLSAPRTLEGARPALSWTAGGFGGTARELLGSRRGPLVPLAGGGAVSGGAAGGGKHGGHALGVAQLGDASDLGPGDAVALVLAQGDFSLAAHGTVTDRVGDSVVAFGHPVYSLG
ncbi:MAG: SpoIVB peptidase S55 domain-containing protein, partial [Acidobacteriota bacterium]